MTDYTKYDYDQLVAAITEKLKNKTGWGDAYNSSMGQSIIQNVAFIIDQLHYMMERRSQENYFPTARLPSSIRSIANAHGYRPRRKVSSKGKVQLSLVDADGNPTTTAGTIFLPKYTRVTYKNVEFLTNEDVTLEPGDSQATFEIIQGTTDSITVDPDDVTTDLYKHNYILFSDYISIEENSLSVSSGGSSFVDVFADSANAPPLESLSFADSTDKVYDIRISNDGMRLIFGDGLFGFEPDSPVTASWIISGGSAIQIKKLGVEFSFDTETLEDDIVQVPKNEYAYTLLNTTAIDGGLDEESVEQIKLKAPEYVRTGNRAVAKGDFEFWAKRAGIGGIVDVFVYGEEERGITVFNMNNVYITYLTSDGTVLSQTESTNLRSYMDELKPITTHLVLQNAEQIELQIELTIKRHPELEISNAELHSYVRDKMNSFFAFEEGSLDRNFLHSEFIDFFHNLTITKNDVVYNVASFVYANIKALKPFSVPTALAHTFTSAYNIDVTAGSTGDVYALEFTYVDGNGDTQTTEVTYTQQAGNTATDIASNLATSANTLDGITGSNSTSTLTVDVQYAGEEAKVTNKNSTTPSNIPVFAVVVIPPRILDNSDNVDVIKPSSIEIFEDASPYTVIGTDNGSGTVTVNGDSSGTIDYTTGKMVLPLYASGDYYIRYVQDNDEQNVFTNPQAAVTVTLPKQNLTDTTDLISTIEILS